jgi:hypothetical protein
VRLSVVLPSSTGRKGVLREGTISRERGASSHVLYPVACKINNQPSNQPVSEPPLVVWYR